MTRLLSTNFGDITVSPVMNIDFSSVQEHAQHLRCTSTSAHRLRKTSIMRTTLPPSPPVWRTHLLSGSWWIFSPDSKSKSQFQSPSSSPHAVTASNRSLTKLQWEEATSDAYPHPCSGDEWESQLLPACKWKPDLSAGSQRVALRISPTLLRQHAPHFCLICALLLSFRPHLIRPSPAYLLLLSFTFFNTASAQKGKKTIIRGRNYFNILHWLMNIQCKQLCFSCLAVKSHVCLLEGEFIWYVGSLNNSALPWH